MFAICGRIAWLGLFLVVSSGCAICGSCDDETYAASGGAWERVDPYYGRVGSAFTPEVGMKVLPDAAEAPPAEKIPAEELPSTNASPNASPNDDAPPQPPPGNSGIPSTDNKSTDASVLLGPIHSTR